jgi:hypothetical protein
VSVTAGETTTGIDAGLAEHAEPGHITGKVTAENGGAPVEGVLVSAYTHDGSSWAVTGHFTETAADGSYTIANLLAGNYRVRYWPTSPYAGEFYDNAMSVENATDISVSAGSVTSGIDVALGDEGLISGRITDEGGAPLGAVNASAFYHNGSDWVLWASAESANDGAYVIGQLHAGAYRVEFVHSLFAIEYFDDALEIESASDVIVTSGNSTTGVDAALAEEAAIRADVTADDSGEDLAGIKMCLYREFAGADWRQIACDESLFIYEPIRIGNLPAGNYRAEFHDELGRFITEYYDNAADIASAADISLTAGSETTIDIALSRNYRFIWMPLVLAGQVAAR